jgi:hypothetical protein
MYPFAPNVRRDCGPKYGTKVDDAMRAHRYALSVVFRTNAGYILIIIAALTRRCGPYFWYPKTPTLHCQILPRNFVLTPADGVRVVAQAYQEKGIHSFIQARL